MSIFTEIYDLRVVESPYALRELSRKLSLALEEGWIEEIPVSIKREVPRTERWFIERSSGEVYALEELEGKPTSWRPVDPEDLFPSKQIIVASRMRN